MPSQAVISNQPLQPVLYEVTLSVEHTIVAEFDAWLREHVKDMLALPGFIGAEILAPAATDDEELSDNQHKRVVQYRLRNRQYLDNYFTHHATAMREAGIQRFGNQFSAERRVLETGMPDVLCPNCGSALVTHYCAVCGQEDKDYHMSFWRLMTDFLGDNFTFDSRLLRSLKPLFIKPGQLTVEYMDGWRARHIPPLRLYLFTSIVFFALLAAGVESEELKTDNQAGAIDQEEISREEAIVLQELEAKGIITLPEAALDDNSVTAEGGSTEEATTQATSSPAKSSEQPAFEVADRGPRSFEEQIEAWVNKYKGNEAQLARDFMGKLPIAMFAMLPLYALLLKLLYFFQHRYYMEHLIFTFHVHAFTFLVFSVLEVWSTWLSPWSGLEMHGLLVTAIVFWLMLYPWFAMRRNYGQGWWMTTLKYLTLGTLYFITLVFGIATAVLLAIVF